MCLVYLFKLNLNSHLVDFNVMKRLARIKKINKLLNLNYDFRFCYQSFSLNFIFSFCELKTYSGIKHVCCF